MSDDEKPDMNPEQGVDEIMRLLQGVTDATSRNDLKALDGILDGLNGVIAATGIEIPDLPGRIDALKGRSAFAQHHLDNTNAALWVGDLDRARALNESDLLDEFVLFGGEDDDESGIEIEWSDGDSDEDSAETDDVGALPDGLEDDPDAIASESAILLDRCEDIAAGKPGAIDAFLASGEDPNLVTGAGRHTPLLAALDAPGRRADQIARLIAAGADPKVRHFFGDTAISWAMGYHHPDTVTAESERALVELLVRYGVDPDGEVPGNWTPFHRAMIQGGANLVAAMLAAGADPAPHMSPNFEPIFLAQATPVMVAAATPDVLRLLLDHGVDAAHPDALGRVPLEFVRERAAAARERARDEDPWTLRHAEALETSCAMLESHLAT